MKRWRVTTVPRGGGRQKDVFEVFWRHRFVIAAASAVALWCDGCVRPEESFQNALHTWMCRPSLAIFLFTLSSFSISKSIVTLSPQPRNVTGGDLYVHCNTRRSVCAYTTRTCTRYAFGFAHPKLKPYQGPAAYPRFQYRGQPGSRQATCVRNRLLNPKLLDRSASD